MEILLWVFVFLVLKNLYNVIFCTKEYWEKEIAKYTDNEQENSYYELPIAMKRDFSNIQTIKKTVDVVRAAADNTIHNIINFSKHPVASITRCWSGITYKLMIYIFKKIDKIAEKIKIKANFTLSLIVFWFILGAILADEIRNYILFLKEISFYNVLDMLIAITTLCLILLVVYFLVRDIGGVISLRQTENIKATVEEYVKEEKNNELKKYLLSLKISEYKKKELKTEFKKLNTALEVVVAFEQIVLKEYDEKVDKVICDYRNKIIIGNGISGSSLLDFAINLYYFYKILRETARIYQIRIGFISLLRILAAGCLVCYAVSKTTNILEDVMAGAFLEKMLIPLKYLVQAVTSGFSMQIYGYWLKYYALRPIKSYDVEMKEQTTRELNNFFKDKQDS